MALQKTLHEGEQWERRVGCVQVQPSAVGPLELQHQAAVAREWGERERDFDKTAWRGGCAERGRGRETSVQLRDLDPELLRHPRRRQHGSERHGLCPQGLGNVRPSLGARLPPVFKLSR